MANEKIIWVIRLLILELDSVREKSGWKDVFKGFELSQTLILELPIDGELVSKVLVEA